MQNSLTQILQSSIDLNDIKTQESIKIDETDYEFFHIEEITFEDEAPKREALENVLGSLRIPGVNFVYLIVGSKKKISFYFGIAKNINKLGIDIDDIAKQILKSNIESNFRGSKINRLSSKQKEDLRASIQKFSKVAEVNGVPDINEEAKNFQGVDRLIDVMLMDEFALLVIASTLPLESIELIEKELFTIYDKISPYVKKTIQKTTSTSKAENETNSKSTSESTSQSNATTQSTSEAKTFSTNTSTSSTNSTNSGGSSSSTSKSSSEQESKSNNTTNTNSNNDTVSNSTNESVSKNNSLTYAKNSAENETTNVEFTKKEFEEWLRYIDEVLLKRLNYAKGKGAFLSGVYLLADTKGKINKLGNSFISLFSGVESNKLPLRYEIVHDKTHKESIYNFQLPKFLDLNLTNNQRQKMMLYSKINGWEWFSTKELSIIASLPQKEVVGLRLKEEVEFGLNVPNNLKDDKINLGKLVRSGQILDIEADIKTEDINKHIFITGVTGSGKTTTCHKLLYSSNLPFLVIEPAKTEYRILTKTDDILVFTFGNENIAPFRLNPFEFFEGENISSRVDMIKAAIESSFDMEAAIPQIIESAIYKAYEKYGWDIGLSINLKYDNPFAEGVASFPMLEDVIQEVEQVVEEQNFDDRLKKDYIGSIKARLQGFMVGSKKFMLNTPRSFDFRDLVHKKVIFELEEIKSPSEKSFIMGLILVNLNEALKATYKKDKNFKHITLIEEAHRLLSKYEAGDSLNKKSGVETFTDMLAEVRKYGEGLIIVDQIPNKLTPEVLKNTNTKIVHRIFANDDKEAIGNTMALEQEQKEFLSKLEIGRAIVFNQSFFNSIQVQITQLKDISTTSEEEISDAVLRDNWLEFIKKSYRLNISNQNFDTLFKIEILWDRFSQEIAKDDENYMKYYDLFQKHFMQLEGKNDIVIEFLSKRFYKNEKKQMLSDAISCIKENQKITGKMKRLKR